MDLEHTTLKDFPLSENPYEKCRLYGADYLTDAELLAVLFRSGTRGKDAICVARDFLSVGCKNLLNLYHLSMEEMQEISGIGKIKAIQLKCMAELSARLRQADLSSRVTLNSAQAIADYYMESLRHKEKEHLLMVMMDTKCNYLGDAMISIGTVNASLISPREIFLKAFEKKAVQIILVHNHPSGDPTPSREDVAVTEQILQCGDLLGIMLLDHIIIGDNKYVSFKEKKLL
ncbi:MAG: DNA repair protein RadC [Lachnospiraceae bacterium]